MDRLQVSEVTSTTGLTYCVQLYIMIAANTLPGMQVVQFTPTGSCSSIGYTSGSGCCLPERENADGETLDCRVEMPNTNPLPFCYCDVMCHQYDDCCSDINQIQCYDREFYAYMYILYTIGIAFGCFTQQPGKSWADIDYLLVDGLVFMTF